MGLDYIPFLSPIQVGDTVIKKNTIITNTVITKNINSPVTITEDPYEAEDIENKMSETQLYYDHIKSQEFITINSLPYASASLIPDDDLKTIQGVEVPYPYRYYDKLYDWMLKDIARSTVVVVTKEVGKEDVVITDSSMDIDVNRGASFNGSPTLQIVLTNIKINGKTPSTSDYTVTLYIERSNIEDIILMNKLLTYLDIPEEAL